MSKYFLLVTELNVESGKEASVAKQLIAALGKSSDYCVLQSVEAGSVVVIEKIAAGLDFEKISKIDSRVIAKVSGDLSGDVNREILVYVEAAKASENFTPKTKYVQLRHIEVKPSLMQEYLNWRQDTIFQVVKESPEVEEFTAYHSLVSTTPGVMFVSGFSEDPEKYQAVFTSPRYQDIVKQAGQKFICGGADGLYTKTYLNLSAA